MSARARMHLPLVALAAAVAALAVVRDPAEPPALAHASFGRGPAVVLVHGLAGEPSQWIPVARRLAPRHRAVLVELPGHGRTPMPAPFSLEGAAAGLVRALEQVADGEPVVLAGHSVGGLVAAEVARRRPDLVRGLVLVETALRPQGSDAERDAMRDALERDYQDFVRAAYRSFGRDAAQGERLAAAAAAMDPAVMKPWIRLALTADASVGAGDIQAPVLAILSDRSWPMDETWRLAATALGYEHIVELEPRRVAGAGHYPMLDDPETVADALARFTASFETGPIATR